MRENFEVQKDEFLNYVDQWDKAQEKKIFGDVPKAATTSSQTSDVSFFGPVDTSPSDNPNQNDLAYWSAIYQTSLDNLASNDNNNILSEEKINRQEKSPNPIRSETEGKDQDLKPQQLGITFDEEDIKDLEEMKIKLHELQSKIAVMNDEKSKDIQKQIDSLQNQIDEISTSLGQAFSSVKK